MLVFGGSQSTELAWDVAKELGGELGRQELKRFPDSEFYIKLTSKVKNKDCVVVQSTRSSDDFMELFLLLGAVRDNGAREIHAVVPYLGYARQDRQFTEGEALSAKTMLGVIDELSDTITTVNTHIKRDGGRAVYHKIGYTNVDAFPKILEYFKHKLISPIVIAPDGGSAGYAKMAAEYINCSFDVLNKKRVSGSEVLTEKKTLTAVKNKDVLILDDIISTGDTLIKASGLIRAWKPRSINVGCVHGLLINGVEPFQGIVDKLVCTNTIHSKASKISVGDLIARELK